MDNFLPTLFGTLVGGAIAIFGQWISSKQADRAAQKAWRNEFERQNIQGVQEAMADLWRFVNAGRPGGAPSDQGQAMGKLVLQSNAHDLWIGLG
ncbi:hypothetical protein [Streptomyces halobius]|uniref:Uncharacterized protein n=1 Tax=Streptomyces halobius TaxID=2879846 RepID=A0ABY4M3M8_9ACTN|nr:hypothetical protein [Streptomyces halobius]UQA91454.1 hypothetical protein K9S39_05790 [Streptomyces halobius]